MNEFEYTLDNKRYHTYNYFLKNKYGGKIAKVSLDAGFTCPNRDGTKSTLGCLFCGSGASEFTGDKKISLLKQFESQACIMKSKWPECRYIAYFQAYTNTYAPLDELRSYYELFLDREDIVGIAIATRADCLDEDIIKYLSELNKKIDIYIELGLQTIHDQTSEFLNRCETYQEVKDIIYLLHKYHIHTCLHIINGLPFETKDMMIETAKEIGQLPIQALKIHNLFLTNNSLLYKYYKKHPFPMLERDEYIDIVCQQLRYIPKEVVIERLTGDAKRDELVEPLWSIKKTTVINDIDKYMKKNNIYQGDKIPLY